MDKKLVEAALNDLFQSTKYTGEQVKILRDGWISRPVLPQSQTDIDDFLLAAHRNDAGNADCMAQLYRNHILYCHTNNTYFLWNDEIWECDRTGRAHQLARETAKARYKAIAKLPTEKDDQIAYKKSFAAFAIASEGARQVELTLKSLRSLDEIGTTAEKWDTNPFLANAGDCTLDLQTCTARPNDPADRITKQLGAHYDPNAKCPLWDKFIHEVLNGDESLKRYVRRAVGLSMTGDIRAQKFFLLVGGGANGKSVFLSTVHSLMHDYAGSTSFDTFDAETSQARQDLAKLHGTRLVTVIETEEDRRLAEARVKSVTGGDKITARELYSKAFDYVPQFKLWIAMNHKPKIRGTDRGIWRRIVVIPFTQSFEGREDDKLEAKLRDELSGILNWALEGLRDWHQQGLGSCPAIDKAVAEYKHEQDVVGQWLHECTIEDSHMEFEAGAGYRSYTQWCIEAGSRPEQRNGWARRLTDRGIKRVERGGRKSFYVGYGLLSMQGGA